MKNITKSTHMIPSVEKELCFFLNNENKCHRKMLQGIFKMRKSLITWRHDVGFVESWLHTTKSFQISNSRFGSSVEFKTCINNLFVTSKKRNHEFTNLKCCIKPKSLLKPLFNGVLFLIYYFN